ncbi:MAG: hypothetical protein DHS20C05_16270 [Hyphococcus sp.]|nr:MAG: hypothetical protein DHS20C05_16270 [Marinicaulis sp.]
MISRYIIALGILGFATSVAAQDSFGTAPLENSAQRNQEKTRNDSIPKMDQQSTPQQKNSTGDQLTQMERQDYGVQPTSQLHAGAMHGPTPASIPGGQIITTKGLTELMQSGQTPFVLFDILGGEEIIPGAIAAVPASQAGSFNDQTQQEFSGFLQQMSQGNKQTPLVFYCLSTKCWMSYNAALRAINMGYTNVLWYRGGIEAWKMAGNKVQSVYQQGGGQPY